MQCLMNEEVICKALFEGVDHWDLKAWLIDYWLKYYSNKIDTLHAQRNISSSLCILEG